MIASAAGSCAVATASRLLQPAEEQRDAGGMSFAGSFMSAPYYGARSGAENVATVSACVSIIASSIASLPATVYERMPDGSRVARPDHPVARVIRQPNDLQSWPDLMQFTMGSVLLQGNTLLIPQHDGAGQCVALEPLPWWNAQPIIVPAPPSQSMGPLAPSGRLAFDTLRIIAPWGGTGVPRRYFADEVFYLRDRSDTGVLGSSRLARAPMVLSQALAVQSFATYLWDNAGTSNVAFQHPGKLSKEASDRIAQSYRDNQVGPLNARKLLILEEGMVANALNVSPEDAQVLQSRRFAVTEICRLFGVPPMLVADFSDATFATASAALSFFGMATILPWAKAIEAEFSRVVFNSDRFFLGFDLSAMLRGDFATQAGVGVNLVRAGILTPNELREQLSLNPHPDGDKLQPQAVGGRPPGTGDGEGDQLPAPGAPTNGSGKANGHAAA